MDKVCYFCVLRVSLNIQHTLLHTLGVVLSFFEDTVWYRPVWSLHHSYARMVELPQMIRAPGFFLLVVFIPFTHFRVYINLLP